MDTGWRCWPAAGCTCCRATSRRRRTWRRRAASGASTGANVDGAALTVSVSSRHCLGLTGAGHHAGCRTCAGEMAGIRHVNEVARRGRAPASNLPTIRDRLVGRDQAAAVARTLLLGDEVGLLTLTGP